MDPLSIVTLATFCIQASASLYQTIDKSKSRKQDVIYLMIPQLYQIFNVSEYETWSVDWAGCWFSKKNPIKDMLLFIYGSTVTALAPNSDIVHPMNISIAAVHLHEIYKNLTAPNECKYAAGLIESSYTRIDCILERASLVPSKHFIPYPDSDDHTIIPQTFIQNYQA